MNENENIKVIEAVELIKDVDEYVKQTLEYSNCTGEMLERFMFCYNGINYEIENNIKQNTTNGSVLDGGKLLLEKYCEVYGDLTLDSKFGDCVKYGRNIKLFFYENEPIYYSSLQAHHEGNRIYFLHSMNNKHWFLQDIYLIKLVKVIREKLTEFTQKEVEINGLDFIENNAPLLKWNTTITTLYTLFYDLLDKEVITYEGKTIEGGKMEIARMLETYFKDKDGKKLSIETIKQTLKPNTSKAKKRIDISPIITTKKKGTKKI